MLKDKAKTYNEIVRKKRIYDMTKYFVLSAEQLEELYDFLCQDDKNSISTTTTMINLKQGVKVIKSIPANAKTTSFDGITVSNTQFIVIPHYVPSSYSGGSSSGFSSNNNNNNN
ncbi:MAG: hypothetical protein IJ574_01085, partial [Bacilli bacterium]|nr:hypothetical protein [Bacilli bacterium]